MEDSKGICFICLEKYNETKNIPKKMSCCNNIICLQCLKKVYQIRKKSFCPLCCSDKMINPDELPTKQSELNQFITCPYCRCITAKGDFYYSLDTQKIRCADCHKNEITLTQYIQIIVNDVSSITQNMLK